MQSLKNLSRRQLLKVGGSALLASSIWPGALRADESMGDNFGFLVVNDLHFFDNKCVPFFEKVISSMAATKDPMDFCIIVGDLSESGSPEQISTVRDLFKKLNMPLYTGGAVQNRVRETIVLEERSRNDLEFARRTVTQTTR